MDLFEKTIKNSTLPNGVGIQDFTALVLLSAVDRNPGLTKGVLAELAATAGGDEKRPYLRYIDCLVGLGYISRQDFKFYLTSSGEKRAIALKQKLLNQVKLAWSVLQ